MLTVTMMMMRHGANNLSVGIFGVVYLFIIFLISVKIINYNKYSLSGLHKCYLSEAQCFL